MKKTVNKYSLLALIYIFALLFVSSTIIEIQGLITESDILIEYEGWDNLSNLNQLSIEIENKLNVKSSDITLINSALIKITNSKIIYLVIDINVNNIHYQIQSSKSGYILIKMGTIKDSVITSPLTDYILGVSLINDYETDKIIIINIENEKVYNIDYFDSKYYYFKDMKYEKIIEPQKGVFIKYVLNVILSDSDYEYRVYYYEIKE
jgi:hypothetical protein